MELFEPQGLKQGRRAYINEQVEQGWKVSHRYHKLNHVAPDFKAKQFAKLTKTLSRRQSALLFQLRTGQIALDYHLHTIGCAKSPLCPKCEERNETVDHFLLYCPAYARARQRILYLHGANALTLPSLLNRERMLPDLFDFVYTTRRFHAQLGDVRVPKKPAAGAARARR